LKDLKGAFKAFTKDVYEIRETAIKKFEIFVKNGGLNESFDALTDFEQMKGYVKQFMKVNGLGDYGTKNHSITLPDSEEETIAMLGGKLEYLMTDDYVLKLDKQFTCYLEYLKCHFVEHLVYHFVLERVSIMIDPDVKSRARNL